MIDLTHDLEVLVRTARENPTMTVPELFSSSAGEEFLVNTSSRIERAMKAHRPRLMVFWPRPEDPFARAWLAVFLVACLCLLPVALYLFVNSPAPADYVQRAWSIVLAIGSLSTVIGIHCAAE